MMTSTPTADRLANLVADFVEWTGGFGPAECSEDEIRSYLETSEIPEGSDEAKHLWTLHGTDVL